MYHVEPLAMGPEHYLDGARERLQRDLRRLLVEQLCDSSLDWTALETFQNPVLRIEACVEEHRPEAVQQPAPGLFLSVCIRTKCHRRVALSHSYSLASY